MKILFAGHKDRGVRCLEAVREDGHEVVGILAHASPDQVITPGSVAAMASQLRVPLFRPERLDDAGLLDRLRLLALDVVVLAGYGPIVPPTFLDLGPFGVINLHGGRLPEYRGSSPMNWALINGEPEFGISIIRVAGGVDTGPVLSERRFLIGIDDTIADLQATANAAFPGMVTEVLAALQAGTLRERPQDDARAAYYPLRFPDDGLILWDAHTALEIHNRIRALTTPYPGAFTFYDGRRVALLRSRLAKRTYHGEPGRIYLRNEHGLLVCANDRCLWVQEARFADQSDVIGSAERYERFSTVRGLALTAGAGLMLR